jgi:hypothetical protein
LRSNFAELLMFMKKNASPPKAARMMKASKRLRKLRTVGE